MISEPSVKTVLKEVKEALNEGNPSLLLTMKPKRHHMAPDRLWIMLDWWDVLRVVFEEARLRGPLGRLAEVVDSIDERDVRLQKLRGKLGVFDSSSSPFYEKLIEMDLQGALQVYSDHPTEDARLVLNLLYHYQKTARSLSNLWPNGRLARDQLVSYLDAWNSGQGEPRYSDDEQQMISMCSGTSLSQEQRDICLLLRTSITNICKDERNPNAMKLVEASLAAGQCDFAEEASRLHAPHQYGDRIKQCRENALNEGINLTLPPKIRASLLVGDWQAAEATWRARSNLNLADPSLWDFRSNPEQLAMASHLLVILGFKNPRLLFFSLAPVPILPHFSVRELPYSLAIALAVDRNTNASHELRNDERNIEDWLKIYAVSRRRGDFERIAMRSADTSGLVRAWRYSFEICDGDKALSRRKACEMLGLIDGLPYKSAETVAALRRVCTGDSLLKWRLGLSFEGFTLLDLNLSYIPPINRSPNSLPGGSVPYKQTEFILPNRETILPDSSTKHSCNEECAKINELMKDKHFKDVFTQALKKYSSKTGSDDFKIVEKVLDKCLKEFADIKSRGSHCRRFDYDGKSMYQPSEHIDHAYTASNDNHKKTQEKHKYHDGAHYEEENNRDKREHIDDVNDREHRDNHDNRDEQNYKDDQSREELNYKDEQDHGTKRRADPNYGRRYYDERRGINEYGDEDNSSHDQSRYGNERGTDEE